MLADLPLFAAVDQAKMTAACRRLAACANGVWRDKASWARIARCSEHAVSVRFSELRRQGYVVEARAPRPGTGEVCGTWRYRIERAA